MIIKITNGIIFRTLFKCKFKEVFFYYFQLDINRNVGSSLESPLCDDTSSVSHGIDGMYYRLLY